MCEHVPKNRPVLCSESDWEESVERLHELIAKGDIPPLDHHDDFLFPPKIVDVSLEDIKRVRESRKNE